MRSIFVLLAVASTLPASAHAAEAETTPPLTSP